MKAARDGMVVLAALVLVMCVDVAAVAQTDGSILVRNVYITSPGHIADGILVSLLVQDENLRIVTRDEIPATQASIALDAGGGFVLGKLNVGEPASFLVLDKDPRADVTVLLDTAGHVTFAIFEGDVVLNHLEPVSAANGEITKSRGWLAYTPPPMALPIRYGDETKWNRWETRWVSGIFVGAIVLDRMLWLDQDDPSRQQVGDLKSFDGGAIRGLRFGLGGTINFGQPWIYTLAGATNAFDRGFDTRDVDNVTLFDYRIDIPLPRSVTLSVGKQKAPISMERIMPLIFTSMYERSIAADAMLAARDVGILVNGTGLRQRMTWAGGIFNDWFDAGAPIGKRATQAIGRVSALAFSSGDDSHVLHLGLSARYTNAKQGIQYSRKPEFNESAIFVDTGLLEAKGALVWGGELAWRRGPFWVESEYLGSSLESPSFGDPYFWGYHVSCIWAITGEMRAYNRKSGVFRRLPIARSVNQGGWGAWELSARWSELDVTDKSVDGGEIGIASVGLTWWLTPIFSFGFNYRHVRLDRRGLVGYSDGLNFRLFLALE